MDVIVATVNAFVVVAMGIFLAYLTSDRFKIVRGELNGLRGEVHGLRGELNGLRVEIKSDVARLEGRMDEGFNAVRSDLVQVALAVGAGGQAAEG